MKRMIIAAFTAVGMLGTAGSASAADLNTYGGSLKDGYVPPMMMRQASPPCYFRAGGGYSWGRTPSVEWTGTTFANPDLGNSGVGDFSIGCGSGTGSGFRGEIAYGYRGKKKFYSDITAVPPAVVPALPPGDPAHTTIQTHSLMFNAYYDLGNYRGFVPYVGAGIGFAENKMSKVYFTGPTPFFNKVYGRDELSFAWALMAGVEYQFTDRWSMDVGYRYIDHGKAVSDHGDTAGFFNPHFKIDDLAAHELTVGVRYKFCGIGCR